MGDFFSYFFDHLPVVGSGLWVTVEATLLGSVLSLVLAFVFGMMAGSKRLSVRGVSRVIVEFFRGTSLYVQLFWMFYALPLLTGYQLSALFCGVIAFGLNFGAYGSEIVRGALNAVPKAQWEAAIALNLSPWQRMRRVILPQAVVQMVPPFTNLLIQLVKSTPLLWLIQAADLTTVVEQMRSHTGATVPAYLTLLVMYFVLAYVITLAMNAVESAAKARIGQRSSARSLLRSRSAELTTAGSAS